MSKWKWHFILVCIFVVVLNEKLFGILQYHCRWPDWPQYMDLWVIEKKSLLPFKICIWVPRCRQNICCCALKLVYWYILTHTHPWSHSCCSITWISKSTDKLNAFFFSHKDLSQHQTLHSQKKITSELHQTDHLRTKVYPILCWFYYFNKVLYGGQEQGCKALNVCEENHPETWVQF